MAKPKRQSQPTVESKGLSPRATMWLIALALVIVTVITYARSLGNGFVNWDDLEYIVNNSDLHDASLRKHFVEKPELMGNFHPLTMISLAWSHQQAWDPSTKQLDARVFHTTDLLLHMGSALLVLLLAYRLSGSAWTAAFVAAVFAVHPMHVESVAWASERKDVLHAFFFFAALLCYTAHLRSKQPWWWLGALVLFVAAVLAKAMAVSLVPVLFLIDWQQRRAWNWRMLIEKLPFIAIALWAGLRAVAAQAGYESIQDLDLYPLWQRTLFACYGVSFYLLKFLVPFNLSTFHVFPLPGSMPTWPYMLAPVALIGLALFLWRMRRNRDLVFGAGFSLATVVLVLQLLPVGGAVVAERYTYIPYVGLAFALAGWTSAWLSASLSRRRLAFGAAGLFIVAMALMAHERSAVWKDGVTLWTDAVAKDDGQPKTWNNYGMALFLAGRRDEAITAFNRALALKHDYADAFYNRGLSHYELGNYEQSLADNNRAIEIKPDFAQAWHNRAGTMYTMGRPHEALSNALRSKELGYPVDPEFIRVLEQLVSIGQGTP